MKEEFKAGDKVAIIKPSMSFFEAGTSAALVSQDEDGDWWANFRGIGNDPGTWLDAVDGVWCVGKAGIGFKAAS